MVKKWRRSGNSLTFNGSDMCVGITVPSESLHQIANGTLLYICVSNLAYQERTIENDV